MQTAGSKHVFCNFYYIKYYLQMSTTYYKRFGHTILNFSSLATVFKVLELIS